MSRSELTRACYALDVPRVEALLAEGVPVDGSDGEIWRGDAAGCLDGAPYYTPLGEACRGPGEVKAALAIVEALLAAGAPVDGRTHRNETPLQLAAIVGRPALLRRLLAAGADPKAVGCAGNAAQALITRCTPDAPGGPKVEALQVLLAAGTDPRQPDPFGQDLIAQVGDAPLAGLREGDADDRAMAEATVELMRVVAGHLPDWRALTQWLDRADEALGAGVARDEATADALGALLDRATHGGADFEDAVRRAIGDEPAERFDELEQLTRGVLMQPAAVAHPAWARLVTALLELTADYGDLTEDIYGVRLTIDDMEDDEGGVLDHYADEELSTVELCLTACTAPGAAARDDFTGLVKAIAETKYARIGYMSFGDDEAEALMAHLEGLEHPDADALRSILRRGFPFADWDA